MATSLEEGQEQELWDATAHGNTRPCSMILDKLCNHSVTQFLPL